MVLHRQSARPATHERPLEKHRRSPGGRICYLRRYHPCCRRDDQMCLVLALRGVVPQQDVGGAGTHVYHEYPHVALPIISIGPSFLSLERPPAAVSQSQTVCLRTSLE